jgi:FAD dependent oxidoreductase
MNFDFIIIGGGIFGCYAATYFAKKGAKVALIEKENKLFTKASLVNQARLHGGYHYPRSIATAAMSDEHKHRFTDEHKDFINFSFEKYYAIDKNGSFTDGGQFERFCDYLDIKCDKIKSHPLFNFQAIESLYLTEEYSFDPVLIADYYSNLIEKNNAISLFLNSEIKQTEKAGGDWQIQFLHENKLKTIHSRVVINATYSATNAVNNLFGVAEIDLMHEISEIALVRSPQFSNIGLTIMDGPFGSLMPWGLSGNLSLSSVAYTHHAVSFENKPSFDCQKINQKCRPDFLSDCNFCPAQPRSNVQKMLAQIRRYFSEHVDFQPVSSLFTIKSKLRSSHIDDARPTEISLLHDAPQFWCLFAGKINSIYEVEKIGGV